MATRREIQWRKNWDTRHELDFVMRLAGKRNGRALLERYLASCHKRERWGEIDGDAMIAFVEELLGDRRNAA